MRFVFAGALALLFAAGAMAAALQSSELPASVKALAAKGVHIDGSMAAPAGFQGYVGEHNGTKMPVYLLPDGNHVMIGSLFDAQGTDLTSVAFLEASAPVYGKAEWRELEQSTWIAEGATKPNRIVYVFTDTECPYCHRLWQESQPLLKDSKTQVRHIIVAVISAKSAPRAAAILASKDRSAALLKHENDFGHSPFPDSGKVSAEAGRALTANGNLMQKLGIFGTPALVYQDADGKVRVQSGVPDPATLRRILLGD